MGYVHKKLGPRGNSGKTTILILGIGRLMLLGGW